MTILARQSPARVNKLPAALSRHGRIRAGTGQSLSITSISALRKALILNKRNLQIRKARLEQLKAQGGGGGGGARSGNGSGQEERQRQ